MVITRTTFHIASVENGESAVSYEVALDTNSVTANGETGKFLTTNLGRFRFIKHIGGNRKEQNDVYDTFDYLMVFIGYDGKCLKYSDGGYYYSTSEGIYDIYSSMEVNDVEEEKVKLIKIFWYDGPVYADDNHNYIDSLCENLGVPAENIPLEILASNTFTVVRDGKKGDHGIGERGSSGPVWRQHVGFVSATADAPYQYYAGGNDERFLDVVLINKVWYRCLQSYKSTGTDDIRNTTTNVEFAKYWTSADMSNFTFIATQFLLAENAKINLFGSNEINLYNPSGRAIFGSFRVVDKDDDYAFWLGGNTGAAATTSITRGGKFKTIDADITGKITAKSGSIGDFLIVDGSIKLQYTDAVNSQSLYFGYGDSGLKAELIGKDDDNNDMACKLVVAKDELKRKNIGLVTSMSGFKSKFAPNELYIGDLFKRAVMVQIYKGSSASLHRYSLPDAGIGCYIDSENRKMNLVLRGLRSGSTGSVWSIGEIYEENGFLKIHKGF